MAQDTGSLQTDYYADKEHGGYATSSNGTSSSTASSQVPERRFGFLQTIAFILNACFANSNYFTTPYYTLALVRSKRICLALWAAGGIYTAIGCSSAPRLAYMRTANDSLA